MVIALFEHRLRSDIDTAEWEQTYGRMVSLALEMPGFVSINRYAAQDETGLAVVRFQSEDALEAWAAHPEHRKTQARGRDAFFDSYKMTVATSVVREYNWSRSTERTVHGANGDEGPGGVALIDHDTFESRASGRPTAEISSWPMTCGGI